MRYFAYWLRSVCVTTCISVFVKAYFQAFEFLAGAKLTYLTIHTDETTTPVGLCLRIYGNIDIGNPPSERTFCGCHCHLLATFLAGWRVCRLPDLLPSHTDAVVTDY